MLTRFYLRHNGKIEKGANLWVQFLPERLRTGLRGIERYRAVIRVHRKDYLIFRESKTFNSKRKADSWLKNAK